MKKILLLLVSISLLSGCAKCVKSHKEMVHHNQWLQMMYINKSVIPIFHPAYDAEEEVCTEYAK